jgi:hypothetical protein
MTAYVIEISARITVRPIEAIAPAKLSEPIEQPNGAGPRKRGRLSLKPKILELGKWTRDNDREARQSKKAGN